MSNQDSTGWQPAGHPTAPPPSPGGYPTVPAPYPGGPYGTQPGGTPSVPPPTYGTQPGGFPTAPPPYPGVYGAQPAYQGHPSFSPYGTAAPQYEYGMPYVTAPTYAHWGLRVAALLLDLLAYIPYWVGAFVSSVLVTPGFDQYGQPTTVPTPAGTGALVLGGLVSLGLWVWNRGIQQARTGQSWGKKVVGLRLAREATGENVGVARALLRDLAHWFDCWILGLGFWFPLWDAKRQTFADKIVKTVSVR